jgi:HSP20 family protein
MYTNRWEPATALDFFDSLDVFRDEMERWVEGVRSPEVRGLFDRTLTPAVDVIETRDAFLVNVDVPGVSKKDLNVTLTGTVLSVQGEKKEEEQGDRGRKFFRKETWAGGFRRTLDLPETADPEKVSADLKDGVLTVTVQKREEVKPRLISVNVN